MIALFDRYITNIIRLNNNTSLIEPRVDMHKCAWTS